MRAGVVFGVVVAAMGLIGCDQLEQLLPGRSQAAPTVSPTATASAVVPEGDWKATKDFDGKWRVADSSGFRDGGFAFFPLIGTPVVIERGVMAFVANAKGQQSQLRKTLRVASGGGEGQRVFLQHRGVFYDHDAMEASAESVDATSEGWSRHGLIKKDGEAIVLALSPVESPAPTTFSDLPKGGERVRLIPYVEEPVADVVSELEDLPPAPLTMPMDATITFEATGPCGSERCAEYTVEFRGDGQMTVSGESVGDEPRVSRLPITTARTLWSQLRAERFFTLTELPPTLPDSRDGDLVVTWGESSRTLDAALFPKARAIADKLANVKPPAP